MTWMHVAIAVGYVLVLLSSMALLHGAALAYKDLRQRRTLQRRHTGQPKSMAARRA